MSMRRAALALALLLGTVAPAWGNCPAPAPGRPLPREAVPAVLEWAEWRNAVDLLAGWMRTAPLPQARLVFLGDSITQGWQPDVYRLFYENRGALNLGISGDATQHMLWRLENGHWPANLRPSTVVLLIGTNNIGQGSRPEDVAIGIGRVLERLQRLAPEAKILLLGVLPRGATAADPTRQPIARLNQLIAACADNRRVFYSDPGSMMLDAQGALHAWVAWDRLHLTQVGYAMLAAAIEGQIRQLMPR
ncbi:MAG: GDSL family lipase [Roseococcus sp.]|nr:GDSL family lipase [Roseococcus sp.]